jgi:hypothetical protein
MHARIGNVRLKIQIDIGVGDVMVLDPRMMRERTHRCVRQGCQ